MAPAAASVCTLADHIRSANTNTAVGFCPAGTSHDIITITEDITLDEPLPVITDDLAIDGRGYTISGDRRFQIFDIESGKVVFKRLTLADGVNLGEDPDGYGGAIACIEASREGGALWRDGECAYVHEVVFRRNIAGELPGGENDDYLTHMNFGSACEDPEVYTLSDS